MDLLATFASKFMDSLKRFGDVLTGPTCFVELCVNVAFFLILGGTIAIAGLLLPAEAAGVEWGLTVVLAAWACCNAFFYVVYPRLWRRILYVSGIAISGIMIWLPPPP